MIIRNILAGLVCAGGAAFFNITFASGSGTWPGISESGPIAQIDKNEKTERMRREKEDRAREMAEKERKKQFDKERKRKEERVGGSNGHCCEKRMQEPEPIRKPNPGMQEPEPDPTKKKN